MHVLHLLKVFSVPETRQRAATLREKSGFSRAGGAMRSSALAMRDNVARNSWLDWLIEIVGRALPAVGLLGRQCPPCEECSLATLAQHSATVFRIDFHVVVREITGVNGLRRATATQIDRDSNVGVLHRARAVFFAITGGTAPLFSD